MKVGKVKKSKNNKGVHVRKAEGGQRNQGKRTAFPRYCALTLFTNIRLIPVMLLIMVRHLGIYSEAAFSFIGIKE